MDGIFLDCFSLSPCYGVECLDGMRELGMDPSDDDQAQEFCWRVTERFTDDVERLVIVLPQRDDEDLVPGGEQRAADDRKKLRVPRDGVVDIQREFHGVTVGW